MKQVLLLDPSPIFRDFVKEKLASVKVSVDFVQGRRDAFTRLLSVLPDLVIIDVEQDFASTIEFLEKKRQNPNTASLPVIIVGPAIGSEEIIGLIRLGVIKYFARPFMMDVLMKTLGVFLTSPINMDTTPCIIEAHKNKNILVVEVAEGLNLDKITMLKFHLADLIANHGISSPKILIIMSNLHLGFVDGLNLEKFFDSIVYAPRVSKKEVKVLATDPFVKQFIEGHQEYTGIQVEDNLITMLNSFVESTVSHSLSELVETKLLSIDKNTIPCCTDMIFNFDIEERKQEITSE
ncbi:MAG: response regulator [Treponema sp.]|nr:response regulator [Treponema sp.]